MWETVATAQIIWSYLQVLKAFWDDKNMDLRLKVLTVCRDVRRIVNTPISEEQQFQSIVNGLDANWNDGVLGDVDQAFDLRYC